MDEFFRKMDAIGLALTYNDVKLKTNYSETMPDDVDTRSKFSRNVPLNVPILSAAMDTVTEYKMAIEMAKLGGLGIIHKNLSPEDQAKQVSRVKFYMNGLVENPICIKATQTMEQILNMIDRKGYSFHSFPVLDGDGKLAGLISQNDFDFCTDYHMQISEVMSTDLITGNSDTTLDEAFDVLQTNKKKILPLVNPQGNITGMYTWKDVSRIVHKKQEIFNTDKKGQLRVGAAIGVYDDAYERAELLRAANIDVVVIDTAHADSKPVMDTLIELKKQYSDLEIVVGNITNPESAMRLQQAGADGIKVGQGPGSICTTRIIAGIGTPQVTAVYECASAVEVPVCADGGLQWSGDIPIAIAARAYSVMMGTLLAGTLESPGKVELYKGRYWKNYRGMGSIGAMEQHAGSRERYGQVATGKQEMIPEGIEGRVPYKGPVAGVIFQCVGGLKRGMGYVGAADIAELRHDAEFNRMSQAGQTESHPHDVDITKESPNYTRGELL